MQNTARSAKSQRALWGILVLGTSLVLVLTFHLLFSDSPNSTEEKNASLDDSAILSNSLSKKVVSTIEFSDSDLQSEPELEPFEKSEPASASYPGIRAQIIDAYSKEPVTRATVWYNEASEGPIGEYMIPGKTRTFRDYRGMLHLSGLEEGTYSLGIKAQGYLLYFKEDLKVPQKEDHLVFELLRGTFIEGKVISIDEEPIADMSVFLTVELDNPDDNPPARRVAKTDGKGSFLFGGLPPGTYGLHLKSLTQPIVKKTSIYLPQGGAHFETMVLPYLPDVEVQLTDEFGNPLVSASIRLYEKSNKASFSLTTDHYGKASCRFVPPGEYSLRLSKSGYQYHIEDFTILAGSDIIRFARSLKKE